MKDFIKLALTTEAPITPELEQRLTKEARLLHVAMGMETEVGEFMDQLKKHIFYGKEADIVNLKEELGDMLWYMAIAMHVLNTDFESEMQRVITKLRTRYPNKFTEQDAVERDLDKEREVLESTPESRDAYAAERIWEAERQLEKTPNPLHNPKQWDYWADAAAHALRFTGIKIWMNPEGKFIVYGPHEHPPVGLEEAPLPGAVLHPYYDTAPKSKEGFLNDLNTLGERYGVELSLDSFTTEGLVEDKQPSADVKIVPTTPLEERSTQVSENIPRRINFTPIGIHFWDKINQREMMLVTGDRWQDFLLWYHPTDGQWVEIRLSTEHDRRKIMDAVSGGTREKHNDLPVVTL